MNAVQPPRRPVVLPDPEALVLPVAAGRGWQEATPVRRVLALLAPALLIAFVSIDGASAMWRDSFGVLYLLLAPFAFYAAARVLRPHPPGTSTERVARHVCASTASGYGLLVIVMLAGDLEAFESTIGWIVWIALLLGPITIIWGLVALMRRAAQRRLPRSSR